MSKNNFEEIIRIAEDFSRGILDDRQDQNMCFAVCAPLHSYLLMLGYDVEC